MIEFQTGDAMSPQPKKPAGDSHGSLGEKSGHQKSRSGTVVHKAGTQTPAEHAAAENSLSGVTRPAHKVVASTPKKRS
jgi:hypothetical protein